ncbi:hypothetical protein AAF712_002686 [Marasmius tenuissimus]|uniref:Uncharacterized protein n=1 Tax=Marasmius tenuissimus TaxID=585030 RepID=A0ABR3A8G2_9AGAR
MSNSRRNELLATFPSPSARPGPAGRGESGQHQIERTSSRDASRRRNGGRTSHPGATERSSGAPSLRAARKRRAVRKGEGKSSQYETPNQIMLASEQPPTQEAPKVSTFDLSTGMQARGGRRGSERPHQHIPSLSSDGSGDYYRSASAEGSSPGTSSYEAEVIAGYDWADPSSVNPSSGGHSLYQSPDSFQFARYPAPEAPPSYGPPYADYYPAASPPEPSFDERYVVEQIQHPAYYYSPQQHRFSQFQNPEHLSNTGQAGYFAPAGHFLEPAGSPADGLTYSSFAHPTLGHPPPNYQNYPNYNGAVHRPNTF